MEQLLHRSRVIIGIFSLVSLAGRAQMPTCPQNLIAWDRSEIQEGERILFYLLDSTFDSYQWYFEGADPISSSQASNRVYYPHPGTYSVSLKLIRGSDSCLCILEKEIRVNFGQDACNFYAEGDFLAGNEEKGIVIGIGDSLTLDPEYNYRDSVASEWILEGQEELFSKAYRPELSYQEAGVYDVVLQLRRKGMGCRLWKKDFITVLQALQAGIRFHVQRGINGMAYVYLIDISRGNPSSWRWKVRYRWEDVLSHTMDIREEIYQNPYPIQELFIPQEAVYLYVEAYLKIERGKFSDEVIFERRVDVFE